MPQLSSDTLPYHRGYIAVVSGELPPGAQETPMPRRPASTKDQAAHDLVALERKTLQDTLLRRQSHLSAHEIQKALQWCLEQPCRLGDLETLQRLIAQAELE